MLQSAGGNTQFPMTVRAFFADAKLYLARGDILVSRSPTFASRLIRLVSGQFFSHAAMIYLIPQAQDRLEHTFVIESLFKGVGIANLETYVGGRHPVEEVGIMRLEGRQFSKAFFKRANGTMLNEVNKPYDYQRFWRIAVSMVFGLHRTISRMNNKPNVYRRWYPRQFICSGFIQYGLYVAATVEEIDSQSVILKNGLDNPSADQMMGTTPEDLAQSDKLTWKYVIRRGWVYEVEGYDDAKRIISGARS